MRKKGTAAGLLFLLGTLAMLCVGCGSRGGNLKAAKEVNVEELAERLRFEIAYADELSEVSSDMFASLFSMDKDFVLEQKTYNNSGASAELISVVRCKEENEAQAVKKVFEVFVSERSAMYRSYNPAEADKLDKAVVTVVGGRCVVLCVSPDSAKAKDIIGK